MYDLSIVTFNADYQDITGRVGPILHDDHVLEVIVFQYLLVDVVELFFIVFDVLEVHCVEEGEFFVVDEEADFAVDFFEFLAYLDYFKADFV